MAKNELLDESQQLNNISNWYKNTDWGFYTTIVWYSYVTIKPFFRGERCLEMGPADGEMTKFLVEDFKHLYVIDASKKYVDTAEQLSPSIKGYTSLFEDFEPEEKYDTIIMSHILEHVVDPIAILEKTKKWLRPHGRVIIVVPNADSLHRKLGVKMGLLKTSNQLNEQDEKIGHRRVYDREELDSDIRMAGLALVAKGGIFLKLLSNSQMTTFEDRSIIEGMFELGKDLPQYCSEIYAVCVKK